MLKSVLYYLLFLTTAVRFVDMLYLLSSDNTSLPIPVIVVTTVMIIYGMVLVVKKFVSNILIRELMVFYVAQAAMISFNLIYTAIACPLQLNLPEMFIVGSFVDLLIDFCVVYACFKKERSVYSPVMQVVSKG